MSLLGSTYVPRRGSAYSVRLDGLLWFLIPVLTLAIIAGIYFALPAKVVEPEKDATAHLLGLIAALLVYLLPCIWAYLLARRARTGYGREWVVLDQARTTTLNDRVQLAGKDEVSLAEQDALLEPRRYIRQHAANEGQEERIGERMIQQALRNASELRRDSDISTQLYVRELAPMRLALRVPQTVALRLGILLSFIGLLQGLQPLAKAEGQLLPQALVPEMVSGLTGAFSCSIAGIAAAILIQMMIVIVDRDSLIVARLLESTWMDLGHTLSQLRLKGDLRSTLDRMVGELGAHRLEMRETSREIRAQTRLAIDSMATNDERLQTFIRGATETQDALNGIAKAQRDRAEEMTTALRLLEDYETRWSTLFTQRLDAAITAQAARQEAAVRELTNGLAAAEKRLAGEMRTVLQSESNQLGLSVDRLQHAMEKHSSALESSADKLAALARQPAANDAAAPRERSLIVPIGGAVLFTLIAILSMLRLLSE